MRNITFISLMLVLIPALQAELYSQEKFSANFFENSVITVYGSTNINEFKLTINETGIPSNSYKGTFNKNGSRITALTDSVIIPVKNFKSKDPLAYSGFLKLVNEKIYPNIYLKLNYLEIPATSLKTSAQNTNTTLQTINANGNISIAGKTKTYMFPVTLDKGEEGKYNVKTRIRLTIRDFGLEPPVEFFGLVKISEWVEIELNTNIRIGL
jgi:hypothetical protein